MTNRQDKHPPQDQPTGIPPVTGDATLPILPSAPAGASPGSSTERLIHALLSLATDSKSDVRDAALDKLKSMAPYSAAGRAALISGLPRITDAISVARDQDILVDLIRLGTAIAQLAAPPPGGKADSPCPTLPNSTLGLLSAVAAKLYHPDTRSDVIVVREALPLFTVLARAYSIDLDCVCIRLPSVFPRDLSLSEKCLTLRNASSEAIPATPPRPSSLRPRQLHAPWSPNEAHAVRALVGIHNSLPALQPGRVVTLDYAQSDLLSQSINALERFSSNPRIAPLDAMRATLALSTCLNHGIRADEALSIIAKYREGALPALPAIIATAQSRNVAIDLRCEAMQAAKVIVCCRPDLSLAPAPNSLGARYAELLALTLRCDLPELTIEALKAIKALGERARPLADAATEALRTHTGRIEALQNEEEIDARVEHIGTLAIEGLSAIDSSGQTVTDAVAGVFRQVATTEIQQRYLLDSLTRSMVHEKIDPARADSILARLVKQSHQHPAVMRRIAQLHLEVSISAAEFPQTAVALLQADLDTTVKRSLVIDLSQSPRRFSANVRQILLDSFPHLPHPQVDGLALNTLRRLQPPPHR